MPNRPPATFTAANAHRWTPADLLARQQHLSQQQRASPLVSTARTTELRAVRVALAKVAAGHD